MQHYISKIVGKAWQKTIKMIKDSKTTPNYQFSKILYNDGEEYLFKQRGGEPEEPDYSPYFKFTSETIDGVEWALITEVNYADWYAAFGNYDIVIPAKLDRKPTMLKAV